MDKSTHAEREERILNYWKQDKTFEKTLQKASPKGDFVFYDGPPFATGTPHYGHILPGTIKDAIPRYKTMQGYRVPRRWGWDCHGLPLENLIEKELGLKTKKDIEELGIEKFNEAAREAVLRYEHIWKEVIPRFGRWADMENSYKTMDSSYTESVWWAFKTLHDKGLVYEGYKSMQLCPRCGTTLSNFEVNQGYKDITDISVYVKFQLKDDPHTFFLAWTTTPWTLQGNAALAVGPDIAYVQVKMGDASYVLAKERLAVLKEAYVVEKEILGKDLVGKAYIPVFDTYIQEGKIYPADFVTTTDGTGIVHIAPAFGQDDYELGKKYDLKFIQHVTPDGKMTTAPFEGLDAKPKDDHQRTDVEVIKYLASKGALFAKEKLVHSYPHCWRCDTPLLNYASSSWFVKVPDFKNKLVKENSKVNWVPESVGKNRFGNWLEGARDWAISRSRYWGAPLPVWKSKTETKIIASLSDIQNACKPRNTIFVMRHGEIESNKNNLISADINKKEGLTEDGKKQVYKSAHTLKDKKIDIVYISPFFRTKETAKIVADVIKPNQVIEDVRLVEVGAMTFDGKPWSDILNMYRDRKEWFDRKIAGLETLAEVRKRVGAFMYEIDKKHSGKNILIISHNTPLKIIQALSKGKDDDCDESLFENAEIRSIHFAQLPRNREYMIDFHRPYIDEVVLHDSKGNEMRRVTEVFDCWFESGSMPFASQTVRPKWFGKIKGYPAQFIAEGLDQTRGWFYSMLVLGTALFGKSPYQNVIVNGLVLAEDGRKMSKRLQNYPDLMDVANKYGADAVRYFMLLSPAMAGEDVRFSEKGVDEVVKKVINRLDNVVSFYEMYKKDGSVVSTDPLDLWILERLNQTIAEITKGMEKYELHTATRPINDFVDDLSTWYLRRSRDRFKDGDMQAISTTRTVLTEFAKLLAPFMPFFAEDMYMRLGNSESVHMAEWPQGKKVNTAILSDMQKVRDIVTLGLEARAKAGIKVRQPLYTLNIRDDIHGGLIPLIMAEVNVKQVVVSNNLEIPILLDTTVTEDLKQEGDFREFLRAVQEARKEAGLSVGEIVSLNLTVNQTMKTVIESNRATLTKTAQIKDVNYTLHDLETYLIIIVR